MLDTPRVGPFYLPNDGLSEYVRQMAGHRSGNRRRLATLSVVSAVTIVLLALAGGLASSLLPGTLAGRDAPAVAAAAIFAASYLALAIGRIPGLAIDRAGAWRWLARA